MTIFDEMRTAAAGLLQELAVPVTLQKVVRSYDPLTRATVSTATNHAARGVLIAPSNAISAERAVGSARRVIQYAIIGLLPPGVAPAVDDRFLIGPGAFRINGVTPMQPDGTAIAWRLALGDS